MQYTIRSGDTLAQIAAAHGTPLELLLSANPQYGTNPAVVHAGDVVLIPNVAPDSSENTQVPRGVRGWLLLLVAGMMVLGPLNGIGRIHQDISMAESQTRRLPHWKSGRHSGPQRGWRFFALQR